MNKANSKQRRWPSAAAERILGSWEEQAETCSGGQTTQKANIYLGDVWTSLKYWTSVILKYWWIC